MVDVTIKSEDAGNLVQAIRTHADSKALRRELSRGLNSAAKPIRAGMLDAIPNALPQRGGLAAQMRSKVSATTTARSGAHAGVSMRFRGRGYDIRTLTSGRIRHPVHGGRAWVDQTAGTNPEAFTGEFGRQKPEALRAATRVVDEIARKVTNI